MEFTTCRGDWALVTGASSGIGREFASKLAAKGMNVVLVARRSTIIEELAGALEKRYGIRALAVSLDLGRHDAPSHLSARLAEEKITVRLLINNAAFGRWGYFEATSPDTYRMMIDLNISAMISLCHHFLADLSSFPSSAIINVSSPAAYNPIPYMAVYAASKAFVSSFSLALHEEWKERGILVQTLVPGPTETEFDTVAGAYASAISKRGTPGEVVDVSLSHLQRGTPVALHAEGTFKQRFFTTFFPASVVLKTVAKMFRPPQTR